MKRFLLCSTILIVAVCSLVFAQPQTIAKKTSGMKEFPGYFTFYWEARTGKIWLEIDRFDSEFLYVSSLPAGLGSNDWEERG
jgi:hypothetical protein